MCTICCVALMYYYFACDIKFYKQNTGVASYIFKLVYIWFLEISFVWKVGVCVCVSMPLSPWVGLPNVVGMGLGLSHFFTGIPISSS